jgi:hypothetical protein
MTSSCRANETVGTRNKEQGTKLCVTLQRRERKRQTSLHDVSSRTVNLKVKKLASMFECRYASIEFCHSYCHPSCLGIWALGGLPAIT